MKHLIHHRVFAVCVVVALAVVASILIYERLRASPHTLAIRACDDFTRSNVRGPTVPNSARPAHLADAANNSAGAAAGDARYQTLATNIRFVVQMSAAAKYAALPLTDERLDTAMREIVEECMADGFGP